jgi:hypothetical protein
MTDNNNIYGKLFNKIVLQDETHLEALLDSMDRERAIFLLVESVRYAYNMNAYTLGESEVISKCIRILSRVEDESDKDMDIN